MKKTNLDVITRLVVLGSILLVASSVFYYLVIYIPGKEKQKVEAQKQEELAKKKAEGTKKLELETCLYEADNNYNKHWNNECKGQGLLSAKCIKLVDMDYEQWRKENNIPKEAALLARYDEFIDLKEDCSCRLPLDNADRIEQWKKDAKAECYKKYQ